MADLDVSGHTKKGIYVPSVKLLDSVPGEYQEKGIYVYIGSTFCTELLPSIDELNHVIHDVRNTGRSLVLLTPSITEKYLTKIIALLDHVKNNMPEIEISASDWGVIKLIKERNLRFSLGRKLSKEKKIPVCFNYTRKINCLKNLLTITNTQTFLIATFKTLHAI